MTMRVIIADDDPLVRAGLRTLLRGEDVDVVGEAPDGTAVLRVIEAVSADVVLMDIQMPRTNGIAAIPAIRARRPGMRIVLMTTFDAERFAEHARVAGADAFVRKTSSVRDFLEALGGDVGPETRPQRGFAALSPRERDVGMRIAGGSSNDQIAEALGVSVNTVKTYVSRIFSKLGVSNRVQLANALNDFRFGRTRRSP